MADKMFRGPPGEAGKVINGAPPGFDDKTRQSYLFESALNIE